MEQGKRVQISRDQQNMLHPSLPEGFTSNLCSGRFIGLWMADLFSCKPCLRAKPTRFYPLLA